MKDSIYFNQPSLKEKRKLKKSMLKELKKFDLEKLNIKNELWPRFKEKELRFSEKCIKLVKMLKLKVKEEILLKIMLILDLLYMLQLQEMAFLLTKKLTSMKFNQKPCPPTKELKNLADLFLLAFSKAKLA